MPTQDHHTTVRFDGPTQHEVERLLAALNRKLSGRPSFVDRPFVVTLMGGIILWLLSAHWQTLQHRNDLRLDLIRRLPSVLDTRANLLNSWIAHIEWIADGKLKHGDQQKIDGWKSQLIQTEVEYFKSESFEDVLIPVEAAFDSPDVRATINRLDQTCEQFETLGQKASGTYNQSESLTPEQIASFKKERERLKDLLQKQKSKLLKAMANNYHG
jgi:hypothetical protein